METRLEAANSKTKRIGEISRKLYARRDAKGIYLDFRQRLEIAKRYIRMHEAQGKS